MTFENPLVLLDAADRRRIARLENLAKARAARGKPKPCVPRRVAFALYDKDPE